MPTVFEKDGYRYFFYSNDHTWLAVSRSGSQWLAILALLQARLLNSTTLRYHRSVFIGLISTRIFRSED
jgi:Na+/proline symporter